MKITKEEMNFSIEKIQEMMAWPHFHGFTGERCGNCEKTANVLAGSPGWFCPCGNYNIQSWSTSRIPYTNPEYGPTRETIQEAYEGKKE